MEMLYLSIDIWRCDKLLQSVNVGQRRAGLEADFCIMLSLKQCGATLANKSIL